jgi:hypothetical protein
VLAHAAQRVSEVLLQMVHSVQSVAGDSLWGGGSWCLSWLYCTSEVWSSNASLRKVRVLHQATDRISCAGCSAPSVGE